MPKSSALIPESADIATDNGGASVGIAEHLIRSGAIDIIVIDSVAALVPGRVGKGKWAE